ncbi:MAG: cell envelope integrity protein TolA [Flavobacteriaceae bacterium]|nr:cell envelope integrity protein TolA [Flavobacteriaceae bacterium]MDH3795480.1 cell envelope integrity protein TolA [Flavobacteriaceae bacterium]
MKTNKNILAICLICLMQLASAQPTPEQQKQAEEAQKKAMEMMKDNPQFKEALKMMEGAEEEMKQERMQKQAEEEKRQKDAANDHLKEFYWRNKVASDTQGKFSDWSWGEVEIGYQDGKGKMQADGTYPYENYVIVGGIDANGQVQLNLPSNVVADRTISTGFFPQMHEVLNDDVNYSNPEAPFLWSGYSLDILKGGKKIGHLYSGNSERTTHNLASPANMKYGDEGYLLYWAYAAEACKATYSKDDHAVRILEGEIEKTVEQYTRVDLNFKPGWNLVKIEVNGNHSIGNRTRWKWKTYTTVSEMPGDAKYYFKYD